MKADTLRKYLVVHTWTGILTSLCLFVAFYAGGIAMFEPEITHWARTEPSREGASADADALFTAFFAAQPKTPRAMLVLQSEDNTAPFIRYKEGGRERLMELDATGQLRPLATSGGATGNFVDELHRKGGLPLPMDIAEPIIGIVSLVYAVALISGVVVLLPSLVKDLFVLRIGRNVKRMWLDLHNLLGVASLPFHIVMALSAAVFCLHDWIYASQNVLIYPQGLKAVETQSAPKRPPVAAEPTTWLPPSNLVARAKAAAPGFEPAALDYRGVGTPKAMAHVAGTDDRHFKRSARAGFALMDPVSGQVFQSTYLPGQQNSGWASMLSSFFSLHFGSYGGEPLRVLYAVLGLMGALLFYTGNVLWIETRTKRLRESGAAPQQPRHVRWVASLNIGVCLGCVAGVSAAIASSRWLAAGPVSHEVIVQGAYHLVFVACVAYAFARGTARATAGLLAVAAFTTALIPATSALASLGWWPELAKPYVHGFVFVDLLSAGGAALLAFLALRSSSSTAPQPS